jgi:hypothetical protein
MALHPRERILHVHGPPKVLYKGVVNDIDLRRPRVLRDFDLRVTALARPRSNCTVIYRSVLSSERALQTYKIVNV